MKNMTENEDISLEEAEQNIGVERYIKCKAGQFILDINQHWVTLIVCSRNALEIH